MDLEQIKKSAINAINNASTAQDLESVNVKYLGRKGVLTGVLHSLKDLSIEDRRKIGSKANALKQKLEELINKKSNSFRELSNKISFGFDVTKPGLKIFSGHLHPLSKIDAEVRKIFLSMNFSVVDGPEIENEYYNFDALNIPANHPARDMWDTFWLKSKNNPFRQLADSGQKSKLLLRTHTSPVQIRYMEKHNPPFQIIVPGRVFRYEATDMSHEFNFYQVEGLMVGSDVSLANFKFVVEEFCRKLFGSKVQFRFRPGYFPFVEPGLEVDIKLEGGGWLEVMGAGMVQRNVFDAVRYNPDEVQGFAFGMGLDRLAMIKYKIPDIRLFYNGDLRFIRQF
ncbi:MAG: phenylalanine--tRNA ligase subunit alpha [Patescibacteria group bacterium]|nr:phenylalanine--tRNA ligase subunit alpha [Patescibacteria group bacterium]